MAWPNILVMLAQASTGLIETWWVSRLGTDALAGMALVFPGFMMMQMLSAGAMGGGISSAIARALGGGRRDDADALVLHAIIINVALGSELLGAVPALRAAALSRAWAAQAARSTRRCNYSNVVFAGNVAGLAAERAGQRRSAAPATCWCPRPRSASAWSLLVPLSPLLIFGYGPFPAHGHRRRRRGGRCCTTALTAIVLGWYILSGR